MRIQASHLRKKLFEVLDEVSKGVPVEVVRFNRPVAKLVPVPLVGMSRPTIYMARVEEFCRKHGVTKFSFFGSILSSDFRSDSDVDVIIDQDKRWTYLEHCQMISELESMFGRRVDLLNEENLVDLPLKLRKSIESTRSVIYATE
jgi:hypothetical protein